MNIIKKLLGIVWMVIAVAFMFFLFQQSVEKVNLTNNEMDRLNAILQWSIILIIFLPISVGLIIFGYYSYKGEYDSID